VGAGGRGAGGRGAGGRKQGCTDEDSTEMGLAGQNSAAEMRRRAAAAVGCREDSHLHRIPVRAHVRRGALHPGIARGPQSSDAIFRRTSSKSIPWALTEQCPLCRESSKKQRGAARSSKISHIEWARHLHTHLFELNILREIRIILLDRQRPPHGRIRADFPADRNLEEDGPDRQHACQRTDAYCTGTGSTDATRHGGLTH